MIRSSELRQALEKPAIEINDVTYTGRLLSWPQSLQWLPKPWQWINPELPPETVEKEVRELLELLAFTSEKGEAMKIEDFMALERAIVLKAIADFFRCLRQSLDGPTDGAAAPPTTPQS